MSYFNVGSEINFIGIKEDAVLVSITNYLKNDGYTQNLPSLIRHLYTIDFTNKVLEFSIADSQPIVLTAFSAIALHIRDIVGANGVRFLIRQHVPLFEHPEIEVLITEPVDGLSDHYIKYLQPNLCTLDKNHKLFGGFFGRFELHRMLIAHHLETKHANNSVVIFHPDYSWAETELSILKEPYKEHLLWWKNRIEKNKTAKADDLLGNVGEDEGNKTYHATFGKYAIEIIFETNYSDIGSISEKTARCLYCGKPFLLYGTPGQLEQLRDLGFKTFSPYINESYDQESNYEKRYDMIVEEINRLSKDANVNELYNIAKYNKDNFLELRKKLYKEWEWLLRKLNITVYTVT